MTRRFFLVFFFSVLAVGFFYSPGILEAGPLRNFVRRIFPRLSRPECPPMNPGENSPPGCSPWDGCPMDDTLVPARLLPCEMGVPITPVQGIALDPRPGTGLILRPGTSIPPPEPVRLLPDKLHIGLPDLDPQTSQQLKSVGGKLDSLLQLAWVVMSIFGAGSVMQSGALAGSGLQKLFRVLSSLQAISQLPSGQPVPSPPGSQEAVSLTRKPGS